MHGGQADLPFRVELWDDTDVRIEKLIALAGEVRDRLSLLLCPVELRIFPLRWRLPCLVISPPHGPG